MTDDELASLTDLERDRVARARDWAAERTGYFKVQGTRPQTLSYGLTDSPAGQLAWIVEKFKEWTDSAQGPARGCGAPRPAARERLGVLVHRHRRIVGQPLLRNHPCPVAA